MKLKKILKEILDIEVKGSKEIEINGICQDSKLVRPGDLFIARKGTIFDGAHFIPEAIATGASAVLTDIYNPFYAKTTQIISSDVKKNAIEIAKCFYDNPQDNLYMVGITGTNGKTTTSYLVKHILDYIKKDAGIIGTNGYKIEKNLIEANRTTPEGIVCLKLLKEMVKKNLSSCVMEVSSHALDQDRVNFVPFDAAIFTNLSHDHLDYHGNLNGYLLAKKKLFLLLQESNKKDKCAIINFDDSVKDTLIKEFLGKVIGYGFDKLSDVRAQDVNYYLDKTSFSVTYKNQKQEFMTPLIGKFNVYNTLAAISLGVHLGLSLETLALILSTCKGAEGRMEKVGDRGFVFVDYAHTPDALSNILQTLKELSIKRIITVFGCGGNRDRQKRSLMAKICEEYSDFSIVTNDNPRGEDPNQIIEQICLGFSGKNYIIEPDRERAIQKALEYAEKEDIVLIAGKGHEKVQVYSHKTIPFDDREVVNAFFKECVN